MIVLYFLFSCVLHVLSKQISYLEIETRAQLTSFENCFNSLDHCERSLSYSLRKSLQVFPKVSILETSASVNITSDLNDFQFVDCSIRCFLDTQDLTAVSPQELFSVVVDAFRLVILDGSWNRIISSIFQSGGVQVSSNNYYIRNDFLLGNLTLDDNNTIGQHYDRNDINIIAIGDWGKGGTAGDITSLGTEFQNDKSLKSFSYQAAVARSMQRFIQDHKVDGIITLGDNFYDNGVKSTQDSLWNSLWRDVYGPSLLNISWFPTLGNHDYGYGLAGVHAQLLRGSITDDENWKMQSTNYTVRFPLDDGVLKVIFIDTTTLAPSLNRCCNEKGGISTDIQQERIRNQLFHIESMLNDKQNNDTWTIVVGHYPIFSSGEHGDTNELQRYLLPLLQKYKVNAYFSGHDHISEHLRYDGVDFFVCGAGSMTSTLGKKTSQASLLWYDMLPSFCVISASSEALKVDVIDYYDQITYSSIQLVSLPSRLSDSWSQAVFATIGLLFIVCVGGMVVIAHSLWFRKGKDISVRSVPQSFSTNGYSSLSTKSKSSQYTI